MKFPLSWLKDHLETDAPLQTIVDRLTSIGLEVEGVEDRAGPLTAFRIARVTTAEQHPNADRLRVLSVRKVHNSRPAMTSATTSSGLPVQMAAVSA